MLLTDTLKMFSIGNTLVISRALMDVVPTKRHRQPGNLTSDPGTSGQSTGEVTRPDGISGARQVQFGLKFQF
ncbi:MAG TPA: hypothetical protein VMR90_01395 [Candidatus Cybelea sp.]|nr:hypothetical protein [Candidatus Cybelea sp.]